MNILQKLENRFGYRKGPNMIYILMGCYILGTILNLLDSGFIRMFGFSVMDLLYMSPTGILHGQVWRLITWVIHPGNSNILMMALMIFIYISIAKTLEQVVGLFRLNFYLISGILLELLAGIIFFIVMPYPVPALEMMMGYLDPYYVYASLFILFALMFPDAQFRLMFIIPIRGKWMVLVSAVLYFVDVAQAFMNGYGAYGWLLVFMIVSAIVNIMLFMLLSGYTRRRSRKNTVNMNSYRRTRQTESTRIQYRHKCEVCGRTEKTNPELEFRYCSKCHGNHEYCMEHLYTHTHSIG